MSDQVQSNASEVSTDDVAKYIFLKYLQNTHTHTLWVRGDLRWWVGGGLTTMVYKRDCRRNCWIKGNREDWRKGFVYMYIYIMYISHKAMLNLGRAVTEGSCLVFSCPQVRGKNVQLFAVGLLRQWGSQKRLLFSFSGNRVLHVRQKKQHTNPLLRPVRACGSPVLVCLFVESVVYFGTKMSIPCWGSSVDVHSICLQWKCVCVCVCCSAD